MINKKKILFVSHNSDVSGGAEDDFVRIIKYFYAFQDKYEIHTLFPKGPRETEYSKYSNRSGNYINGFFPVVYEKLINYVKYFIKAIIQIYQFNNFVKKNRYDMCVVNVVVLLWPAIFMKLKRFRVIFFIRETIEPLWLRKLYYKVIVRIGTYFFAVSETNKLDFIRITGNKKIETIYSAIESSIRFDDFSLTTKDTYRELFNEIEQNRQFKFLTLGAISNRKNQKLILHCLKILKRENYLPMPLVIFLGKIDKNLDYYNEFSKFITDNKLEQYCIVAGEVPRYITYEVFGKINACIISSISEGMPLTLVETFRFKKPLISTNVGGIKEVVTHKVNGILVNFDPIELSLAVKEIMENNSLYKKIVTNASNSYILHFNLARNLERIEKVISLLSFISFIFYFI